MDQLERSYRVMSMSKIDTVAAAKDRLVCENIDPDRITIHDLSGSGVNIYLDKEIVYKMYLTITIDDESKALVYAWNEIWFKPYDHLNP